MRDPSTLAHASGKGARSAQPAPFLPVALQGQPLAEELLSALGWGLHRHDPRATAMLDLDPDVFYDPTLKVIFGAMVELAGENFTWGRLRQQLLEDTAEPESVLHVLVANLISPSYHTTLGVMPALRSELEALAIRREAYVVAADLVDREGGFR